MTQPRQEIAVVHGVALFLSAGTLLLGGGALGVHHLAPSGVASFESAISGALLGGLLGCAALFLVYRQLDAARGSIPAEAVRAAFLSVPVGFLPCMLAWSVGQSATLPTAMRECMLLPPEVAAAGTVGGACYLTLLAYRLRDARPAWLGLAQAAEQLLFGSLLLTGFVLDTSPGLRAFFLIAGLVALTDFGLRCLRMRKDPGSSSPPPSAGGSPGGDPRSG